jgi:hypothetical protein
MTPTHEQLWNWASPKRMRNLWKQIETVKGYKLGCWLWTGSDDDEGYGIIQTRIEGKKVVIRVHRLLLVLCYGADFPTAMVGDHYVCPNRGCCHPMHVLVTTQPDNLKRRRKPRSVQGRLIAASKLTAE